MRELDYFQRKLDEQDVWMKNWKEDWKSREKYRISFWQFLNLPLSEVWRDWV